MSHPLRFGILGAAKIAPTALVDPAKLGDEAIVTAIAARDPARAHAFAQAHEIPQALKDYAAVVESPDVDVVYNPLPMHLHAEWTIAALRAGKHVLCEKPFAANADEAEQMVRVADENDRMLVEAFHYRYHPLFERVMDIVDSGVLGPLRTMEGVFCAAILDHQDLRHQFATAGGATMDLGCYPLHWMRTIAGPEPTVTSAKATEGAPHVDIAMEAQLQFPDGISASMRTSMEDDARFSATLKIEGARGILFVKNPLAPQLGHRLELTIEGETTSEQHEGQSTYRYQLIAFCDAVKKQKKLPTMGQDSINNMRLIDSIYQSAGLPIRGKAI